MKWVNESEVKDEGTEYPLKLTDVENQKVLPYIYQYTQRLG